MSPLEIALAVLLGTWLLLTPLVHLPLEPFRKVRRLDKAGLLPYWNFFAPNPAVVDLHLLFQYRAPEEGMWIEYPVPSRHKWSWIFHSDRRRRKAIVDLASQLGSDALASADANAIRVSAPYILFLDMSQALAPPVATSSRFAIMSFAAKGGEPDVVFLSDFHPLP